MNLWKDIAFAARLMIKARWFTLAAAVPLALGIGANTTVFTLVNAVLLRGLPFEDPDRIVRVWSEDGDGNQMGVSYPEFRDWKEQVRSFGSLGAYLTTSINVSDDEHTPERTEGAYVSWDFFRMIGVQPAMGRDFVEDDDVPGAEPAVLIGHSIWVNRFGSDANVLGRTIRVNSKTATIIGVMPQGMRFPDNTDIWVARVSLPPESNVEVRTSRAFQVVGRLADGVPEDVAISDLQDVGTRIAEAYPEAAVEGGRPNLQSFAEAEGGGEIQIIFSALMGAVAFVLLIACANVANLLLVRSADRTKEMAVRVSLGATRWRVIRQLLIESLLLSILAGAVGFGLSLFGIRWFDSVTQNVGKPYWMEFTLDGAVFTFMAAVCLSAAVLFGLAPALQISRTDVNEVLKEGTRGGTGGVRARRWAGSLLIGEVILTLVLLSGAAFMMRSFLALYVADAGIETTNLSAMELYLPLTQYPVAGSRGDVYQRFDDRLDAAPEIQAHTLATSFPLGGGGQRPVEIDGKADEEGVTPPLASVVMVGDEYFDVFGIELTQGRSFNRADGTSGSLAAIVNQRFVDLYLGGGEALGHSVRSPSQSMTIPPDSWLTIVGVVPTIEQASIEDVGPAAVLYLPLRTDPIRTVALAVRTPGGPAGALPVVQAAMAGVDPDLPFYDVMTMDELLAQERWPFRIFGLMFTVFAGIALVLSAVGVYSVTAHTVVQRTREMGIRTALGAEPKQLLWLVLQRSLVQLGIAVPIGLAGAFGVGQILQSLLVGVSPTDPIALGGIVLIMVSVSVAACVIPARRAARVDPMVALRIE